MSRLTDPITHLFASPIQQAETALATAQQSVEAAVQKLPQLEAAVSAAGVDAARTGNDAPIVAAIDAERIHKAKIDGLRVLVKEAEEALADAQNAKAAEEREKDRQVRRSTVVSREKLLRPLQKQLKSIAEAMAVIAANAIELRAVADRLGELEPRVASQFFSNATIDALIGDQLHLADPKGVTGLRAVGAGGDYVGKLHTSRHFDERTQQWGEYTTTVEREPYVPLPAAEQFKEVTRKYIAGLERHLGLDLVTNEQDETA